MAEHGGDGVDGDVINQPENRGGPMAVEETDQTMANPVGVEDTVVEEGGDDGGNREQATGGEENRRASETEPCATEPARAVESISEPAGMNTEARASPTVGGSSGGVEGSGVVGDDPGPSRTPLRDSAKGKEAVIAEEPVEEEQMGKEQTTEVAPVEIREEDIAFRPPASAATSSRHVPITYDDIAEHTPDAILARLLEERPDIGELVLKAKEDRARAVEAAETAERAERERKDREEPLRDMETEERAAEEALGPRVTAVAEAAAVKRPDYTSETYMPPIPHLFVPSGFSAYTPQRLEYDDETVLRNSLVHIANTWAEVNPKNSLCTSISTSQHM
ncbi:hypothetical protein RHMOL_Rhmol01G0162400 [Rhododendron molle]|uniref:Uncharacterized protein n=1 Tax=Rhododendron molle TaxID=49168 RepID=A0ACC0Q1X1_RHOML|nr:hypothetical protein RHMOL_Rhmol01G0162400 [Rhododendron molle]